MVVVIEIVIVIGILTIRSSRVAIGRRRRRKKKRRNGNEIQMKYSIIVDATMLQ